MSELVDWVGRIQQLDKKSASIYPRMQRLLAPGWQPLDFEGFVRSKGQGHVASGITTPYSMSILVWAEPSDRANTISPQISAEFGSLLSLISDRKITVLPELDSKHEGKERYLFLPINQLIDARLVSPPKDEFVQTIDEQIKSYLSKLCSLNQKHLNTISEAMNLHYGAVQLYELDLSAAYTLVVAGIETLSREFGRAPSGWSKWDQSKPWDDFMKEIELKVSQKDALRKHLLKQQHIRLKETFVNYVIEELPDSFWESEWQEWMYSVNGGEGQYVPNEGQWTVNDKVSNHLTQDREQLRSALRKSYDARSVFVHQGKRDINFFSNLSGVTRPDYSKPLPFSVLRSILACLIKLELERNSSEYELPDMILKHEKEE